MKSIFDVCYSSEHEQYLDIHLPECETFSVLVYFHGGGFERGDKARATLFAEQMTQCGIAVISANYRLYPRAKYPDFLEDAAQAVAWVFHNIHCYGNVTGIYVGGSSAGGYLSQMLCFDSTWLAAHNLHAADIAGFIHDSGQPTCHFNVLRERGIDSRRVIIDKSAPLYHVKADQNYPPMLIIVADNDIQNRYEQTMLLVSTLSHFGYAENVHLQLMHGKHCAHVKTLDENGICPFSQIATRFIEENPLRTTGKD